ncbi:MAG: hypothetical protein V3U03_05015 [Myxococcota bacterium]
MSPRGVRAARLAALSLYAGWGLLYIVRTSFYVAGQRAFCLWDDAMISMRYAKLFASGQGLVWNADGERVQGFSNLGVTLVMALLHALPVDEFRISLVFQLLNLALLLAILWLVYDVANRLFPGSPLVGLGALLVTGLYGPLAIWGLQGSDVAPVCLVMLLALRWTVTALRDGRDWPLGAFVLLAAGIVLRLDFAVVFAVFVAASLWLARRRWLCALVGLGALLAACAAVMLFSWLYYGDPLPNSFYLKATGHPRAVVLESGLRQTLALLAGPTALLLGAGGLGLLAFFRRDRLVWLLPALIGALFAYNLWVGGDWNQQHVSRFLVPAAPLFFILWAGVCWRALARALGPAKLASPGARVGLLCLVLLACLALQPRVAMREWLDPRAQTLWKEYNRRNFAYGIYFRDHTAPETTLALHWAGTIGYLSERRAVDVLGKSDRHIARLEVARFIPGHSKWDWDYVLSEHRPDVFRAASRGLEHRPDFTAGYYHVINRDGLGFFLRKDARDRLLDEEVQIVDQLTREPVR